MQGTIDMNNHKITNLPDPTLANDPITKQYANRVYLTDGGFTMQDNIGMNNHEVLDLNPVPSDGTAAVSKSYSRVEKYNITLWGDCGGSGYNASTKFKYWSWSLTNKVTQDNAQGEYFHRGTGKRTRIKGSFLNQGTRIFGQEIALSLDYEKGITYEFVKQHLASRSSDHVLGNAICIYFVFEPDNQRTMDFTGETYFSFKRLLKL